jgi:hypothetical protein
VRVLVLAVVVLFAAGCGNDFDPSEPINSHDDALKAANYA